MFLLYHSEGCNICEMVLHECYVNDLHTTTCSGMLGHHTQLAPLKANPKERPPNFGEVFFPSPLAAAQMTWGRASPEDLGEGQAEMASPLYKEGGRDFLPQTLAHPLPFSFSSSTTAWQIPTGTPS
jgi:hypothetical protein